MRPYGVIRKIDFVGISGGKHDILLVSAKERE
jgi:hypothetical protein